MNTITLKLLILPILVDKVSPSYGCVCFSLWCFVTCWSDRYEYRMVYRYYVVVTGVLDLRLPVVEAYCDNNNYRKVCLLYPWTTTVLFWCLLPVESSSPSFLMDGREKNVENVVLFGRVCLCGVVICCHHPTWVSVDVINTETTWIILVVSSLKGSSARENRGPALFSSNTPHPTQKNQATPRVTTMYVINTTTTGRETRFLVEVVLLRKNDYSLLQLHLVVENHCISICCCCCCCCCCCW